MLCYAMLCYAMICYAMLCYAMLCYAMLCYAMLCYAMLCYAMLWCSVMRYGMAMVWLQYGMVWLWCVILDSFHKRAMRGLVVSNYFHDSGTVLLFYTWYERILCIGIVWSSCDSDERQIVSPCSRMMKRAGSILLSHYHTPLGRCSNSDNSDNSASRDDSVNSDNSASSDNSVTCRTMQYVFGKPSDKHAANADIFGSDIIPTEKSAKGRVVYTVRRIRSSFQNRSPVFGTNDGELVWTAVLKALRGKRVGRTWLVPHREHEEAGLLMHLWVMYPDCSTMHGDLRRVHHRARYQSSCCASSQTNGKTESDKFRP